MQKSYNSFFSNKNLTKLTLRNENWRLFNSNKQFFKKLLKDRPKVKHKNLYSKNTYRAIHNLLFSKNKFDTYKLSRIFSTFSYRSKKSNSSAYTKSHQIFFKNLFDINFLRKEKIYTKLKYSRVPQYDTVSGASAALLAGFLGFLICEKFGFELLDSGDFYFLFMYLVFISFSFRLFVKLFSAKSENWNILGYRWAVYYYLSLFNFFKYFFKIKS